MKSQQQYTLIATCAAGLEDLVHEEIASFGGKEIESGKGVITWQGDLAGGYRACLWSRFASRILLQLAAFPAPDDTELYRQCGAIDWQEHMENSSTFAINCTLSDSVITHNQFAALRVKDALVDQFRERSGERPSVQVERPDLQINLHIHSDQAILALDLSGESLHRRGYRVESAIAPLKESLAAGIVALACRSCAVSGAGDTGPSPVCGWNNAITPDTMLLDPMCGSGTLLIEAALMVGDSAPGLGRRYFGFLGWKQHDEDIWQQLVDEAIAREEAGMDRPWPVILGYDADPVVVAAARKNIEQAGLTEKIRVKQGQLATLKRPADKGFLICNPPYGERLGEAEEAVQLYRALGRVMRAEFSGWQVGFFIAAPDFGDRFGLSWTASHRLYNGPLACRLFCAEMGEVEPEPLFQWQLGLQTFDGEGSDFANRLVKNLKKMLKWAEREDITCFRVYDRDLPEYNVTIDLYGKWVHVQEYAPPATIDPDLASQRFSQALASIREVLGVRRDRIFIKTRKKQKGKQQYQKQGSHKKMHEVREGQCFFLVNFTDYLDTGLFLDHRITRSRIGRLAAGKRFLNLFGYTGAATIHAARGGAVSTTTVDLSATYLSWARMNLALNGYGGPTQVTIQEDCLQWLENGGRSRSDQKTGVKGQKTAFSQHRGEGERQVSRYDLIFVDPPTFSNTKKDNRVFDVQEDHGRLLELAMHLLAPAGLLIFSTNFRKFVLDESLGQRFAVCEISRETIPLDFERNSRVHRCWEFRHKAVE
ncbi:MAG: bifunctional 23S rRNA (guanine(2069)-N(7))-methyltransferase RlmK/23S rRNA (guanine(2445)-N(2))-methyltransferase RlmL [Desulfobulbaceae bacterium]|nr:bifunctional 23S rRNA (guanine(2069)-N(7))-methyltransferase RlmK/23S rRNA (guanine(2445)-N(2))-methyltransferase RlmL [Desulfobulbaceae bacterium]